MVSGRRFRTGCNRKQHKATPDEDKPTEMSSQNYVIQINSQRNSGKPQRGAKKGCEELEASGRDRQSWGTGQGGEGGRHVVGS